MMKGEFERIVTPDPCTDVDQFGASLVRLNRSLDHRFAEARAQAELTSEINEGLFLDEVLDHVFETFREIIPYDRIGFSLLEDHKVQGRVVRAYWARSDSTIWNVISKNTPTRTRPGALSKKGCDPAWSAR